MAFEDNEKYARLLETATSKAADELTNEANQAAEAIKSAEVYSVTRNGTLVGACINFYPEDNISGAFLHTYRLDELQDPPTEEIVEDLKERAKYVFDQRQQTFSAHQETATLLRARNTVESNQEIPEVNRILLGLDSWRTNRDTNIRATVEQEAANARALIADQLTQAKSIAEALAPWPTRALLTLLAVRFALYTVDSHERNLSQAHDNMREMNKLLSELERAENRRDVATP